VLRITPTGELCTTPPPDPLAVTELSGGLSVWLERTGPPHLNDLIILERLALAVRIRHGQGRRDLDNRRELGLLLDAAEPVEDRQLAAARLGLSRSASYRVIAAPLFAVWTDHPDGHEDVVPTEFGPIHALVVPHDQVLPGASPSGAGVAGPIEHLPRSFRTAVVALRLCAPPEVPSVQADAYGGLIGLLAGSSMDSDLPDVDLLDLVMAHPWGACTVDALIRAGSIRQAARLAGVHHSTMQTRIETICDLLGFDPLDGLGRTRLAIAHLVWRLRHSRVLDLPSPSHTQQVLPEPAAG
jgi:methyl acetate hydrolase